MPSSETQKELIYNQSKIFQGVTTEGGGNMPEEVKELLEALEETNGKVGSNG